MSYFSKLLAAGICLMAVACADNSVQTADNEFNDGVSSALSDNGKVTADLFE